MKQIPKMSEKTLYTVLWSCIVAAAAAVVILTIFAMSKRGDADGITTTANTAAKTTVNTTAQTPSSTTPKTTDEAADVTVTDFKLPASGEIMKHHAVETLAYSLTMNDWRTHQGIDIAAEAGSDVYACASGTVSGVYTDPFMGVCVEISHDGGYTSTYMNLESELPEYIYEGAYIGAGEVIGNVGESAIIEIADEPHLHFELSLDGVQLDPLSVMNFESAEEGAQ